MADTLHGLPGVHRVEIGVAVTKPTGRIIHLRDWHYVPRDLYALDLRASARGLTDDEIDRRYREFLLEVELVQLEQMALLRCLIRHHGLKRSSPKGFRQRSWEHTGIGSRSCDP